MKALSLSLVLLPLPLWAATPEDRIEEVLNQHILPGFEALAAQTEALKTTAAETCDPQAPALRDAWAAAFDAWLGVSHLRFGPTERDERAFALAYWPDTKGFTPRTLGSLIDAQDPAAETQEAFSHVSIAARGFYAMELLLFDDAFAGEEIAGYRCTLVQAVARDIDANADAILADWQGGFADDLRAPGDGAYRDTNEVMQELYGALTTGLQFTSDTRLGRPLGTFDRPRPTRAEAYRSERSQRHVVLSLTALRDLALHLAADDAEVAEEMAAAFDPAIQRAQELNDPTFAGVADPMARIRIEGLQTEIDAIRTAVAADLGPALGVTSGFNALDGD
ncbi:imelysin family protein [Mesobacterium pallidum]|uniref:imelysin family protein n=1 Tax=Mesobacterium pallidum TaxID=2872037 RepID=UPI001EE1D3E2|nr:imelysin family protein [Mesobacterium pallidum]